jgi:uncharacterized protein (DUF2141 family)
LADFWLDAAPADAKEGIMTPSSVCRAPPVAAAALLWMGLLLAVPGLAAESKPAAAGSPTTLTVKVTGLRNDQGRLAVALFSSAAAFPRQETALRGQMAAIAGGHAAVTFHDLPPGTYAVAVLHDENSNQKMDFNFLGMPLEGYGFSNDAAAFFGPPSFASAAFRLLPRPSTVSIRARYFP